MFPLEMRTPLGALESGRTIVSLDSESPPSSFDGSDGLTQWIHWYT